MANVVHEFVDLKKKLFNHFKCPDDYFIQHRLGFNWEITGDEGIFFLEYWENINEKTTAVVVKKNDEPLIYKSDDYTMVIAIDCVKIAFIFNNVLECRI